MTDCCNHEHQHETLSRYGKEFEAMAREAGLQFHPVDYELVPGSFMMEVAVYGLPVRMPHWSFGVRYIYQHIQHRMGHSKIFEVVFPGNPNRAYLVEENALAENALVTAHVLGHADFSRCNELFVSMQEQVGWNVVEQAAERAHRIQGALDTHGQERVEAVLDAALALEPHVHIHRGLHRQPYSSRAEKQEGTPAPSSGGGFGDKYARLPGENTLEETTEHSPASCPPHPENDLLWFIARYAPDMEDWERDIFLDVREESFYFYPVFACQIMNEGWASYWHARLLREADFLPHELYLDAIRTHSSVVRPFGDEQKLSLQINPYHLGFVIWEHIIETHGLEKAMEIRRQDDDFSFVRNYLDEPLARELKLFSYKRKELAGRRIQYSIDSMDIDRIREQILAPKFNFGAPRVRVLDMTMDGSLLLGHEHAIDGRGLDLKRAARVLDYVQEVWRRPIRLETIDGDGEPRVLERTP